MILSIFTYVIIALLAAAVFVELRRDLMLLQQNSYRNERYMRWLRASGDTTSWLHLWGYVAFFCTLPSTTGINKLGVPLAGLLAISILYKRLTATYKKPLVMTKRATRILCVQVALAIIVTAGSLLLWENAVIVVSTLTFIFAAAHAVTMAANWLLKPVEASINRKFYNDAAARLKAMPDLKVIGVTGSYGKTSTKHYLHRILSEHFDTVMTPGSFNTTLGVVRTIREYMKPYNQVFICEMGAKQPGDIKEICDLVHPAIGIVTAVGPQHLETFKTIDTVRDTKFELVDALPSDGLAVVNNDFEPSAGRAVNNVECVRYAVSNPDSAQFTATDITYTPQGTTFTVKGPGIELPLATQLVGECNISNLVAAVIVALRLGVPTEKIAYAVSKIEQVEHRLQIKRAGTLTIIDDAFNSNPSGSRMALDVLAMMKPGRRFLITPGMIELGDEQYELNRRFGEHAATCADVVFIVNQYNREAINQGLLDGGFNKENIHFANSFLEAYNAMLAMHKAGDTVLIENDLPDTFK